MRRVRVKSVMMGLIELEQREAHHARDVLRLPVGAEVEVFDEAGRVGVGRIESAAKKVVVRVERVEENSRGFEWWVAAAIPKGNRGDWMAEKLSELGAWRFVPLKTARSVVVPEGKGKFGRWERIANESAKQSRRRGVMKIDELRDVPTLIEEIKTRKASGWYLSTVEGAEPIYTTIGAMRVGMPSARELVLLIGPEGGWTRQEMGWFMSVPLTGVRMGGTILRVETAAVAAAAIVAAMVAPAFDE